MVWRNIMSEHENTTPTNVNVIEERKKRLNLYFGISKWSTEDSYMHTLNQYAVAEWKYRKRIIFVPDEGRKFNITILLLLILLFLYIRKLKNRRYNYTFMFNTIQERIRWQFDLLLNKLYNLHDSINQFNKKNRQRSNYEKLHEEFSNVLIKNHVVKEKNFCNNYFKNEIKCLEKFILDKKDNKIILDDQFNSSFFDTYFKCFYSDKKILKSAYELNEKEYVFNKCKMYFESLSKKKNTFQGSLDGKFEEKDLFYLKKESSTTVIKKISKVIEINFELDFINDWITEIFNQIYFFFYELLFFNINFFFLFNIIFLLVICYNFFCLKTIISLKKRTEFTGIKKNKV